MKKFLTILATIILCLTVVVSLTSCYKSDNADTPNITDTPNDNTDTSNGKVEVSAIFISRSDLTIGIGESEKLIATISPANAVTVLHWSSSDSSIAEVDDNGNVTGNTQGMAVIKVQAENGILAVCNVTVKIKSGIVTGDITYKYNDFVGNKSDTDSTVILISTATESLPDSLGLGLSSDLPDGVYLTKVSGTGKYIFNNIPIGEYYIIVISKNTNEKIDSVTGARSWGPAYYLFSEKGQENALLRAKLYKTRWSSIEVLDGETTTYSYDFGVTYI